LAIWAAKNGRADVLEALLDADRGGKMFAHEINFIQVTSPLFNIPAISCIPSCNQRVECATTDRSAINTL
jgi:hypothetical protein